jgi:retron-type reverse transcriptase
MAYIWDKRNTYRFLVEKSDRKRPFGKPTVRYVVNIKMHLKRNRKRSCGVDVVGPR